VIKVKNTDLIQVDQEKCTQCGLCIAVCRGVLSMGDDGLEVIRSVCIGCGQCVAICPQSALDNAKSPLIKQMPLKEMPVLDAATAAQFLRSRRSIRDYHQRSVPREKVLQLLDIARMAPTACNSQGIAYHVVTNSDTLRAIATVVTQWAEGELNRDSAMAASPWAPNSAAQIEIYHQTSEDIVLRSAPCFIVAIADKNSPAPVRDNAYLSLAYAQLFATSIGLGTCWAGLFEYCAASGYEPLLNLLDMPADMRVISGLMVGYPKYTYQRLVDRNPLQVTWQ
jgi:nitroreductase/NAD-dependent dihydropyrimidine dehydrogenase PreA subunit